MASGLPVASVPDHRRHHHRSARQGRRRRALPGRQRPASDQLASAARSATEARARAPISRMPRTRPTRRRAGRGVDREVRLARDPLLGFPDASQAVHRVGLLEVPHPGHRHSPGQEAASRLPADRQVRLHGLPHDRRRRSESAPTSPTSGRSARTSRTSPPRTPRNGCVKWITNPHAFRPDSRMPRFYGLTNNNGKEDWPKNYAEIHAITHYLFTKSTPPR